eukprot:CAMPEP_0183525904 /NCGR_PEP_ID=MMETSP0371-20130417/20972_1 /TAXON_ID=268820 /ORGANISM="Peridinium aciculiferum, Strain PAER-2" /LENGTH=112 /DNA_ID=CAMNT_0025725201 /DNA_START=56 /DNA_END=392 /DNA_ORIENTATION=-
MALLRGMACSFSMLLLLAELRPTISEWQSQVYNYEPMPFGLTEEEQKRVLDGQGELWSEYFAMWTQVEYLAHPRSMALAERLWTPFDAVAGFDDFRARLEVHSHDMDAKCIT